PTSSRCTSRSGSHCATRCNSPMPAPPLPKESTVMAETVAVHNTPDTSSTATGGVARRRGRKLLVYALRIGVLVVFLGGWQVLTAQKILDPFFWGQPSKVGTQLVEWARDGTPLGSLWVQVWVTMKEALLGFGLGVAAGIVCGIALGRVQLLSQVFGSYIKVANSIPRIVLGAVFIVSLGVGLGS